MNVVTDTAPGFARSNHTKECVRDYQVGGSRQLDVRRVTRKCPDESTSQLDNLRVIGDIFVNRLV